MIIEPQTPLRMELETQLSMDKDNVLSLNRTGIESLVSSSIDSNQKIVILFSLPLFMVLGIRYNVSGFKESFIETQLPTIPKSFTGKP